MDRADCPERHRDRSSRVRLAALPMINRNADARGELLAQIALLEAPEPIDAGLLSRPPFCVTIDGQRQDDAMLALVKVVVLRELRARVAALEFDLRTMGVDIPRAA